MTSVHSRNDVRVFLKEILGVSSRGYITYFMVADGVGNTQSAGIRIIDVGKTRNRMLRMVLSQYGFLKVALWLDADLYHFHDPELIPVGLILAILGKRVIYDVHEDVPRDILSKEWLPKSIRPTIAYLIEIVEDCAVKRLSGVCTATPFLAKRFGLLNSNVISVCNYPVPGELDGKGNGRNVCYVGGISVIRGIREMVRAMELVKSDVKLLLGGEFSEPEVEEEVKGFRGWRRVDALGWLDRYGVREVLNSSIAGLVVLHPIINYLDSLPVKMFEYMSANLPVIASNFPLWKQIVEENGCGVCVDPLDSQKIAEAIDILVASPRLARRMGKRGREMVERRYNWENEKRKLLELYERILG